MAKFSTFLYHTGVLYGETMALDSISPATGPSTGGTPFILSGVAFEFTTFDDYFIGGSLDPVKWVNACTGTGALATGATHLVLSTGFSAGSISGVQMDNTSRNSQYEIRVNIPPIPFNPTATIELVTLSKNVDANNYALLSIRCSSTGSITLASEIYRSGSLLVSESIDWTVGISTLKILQWYGNIYFYANGSLVYSSKSFPSSLGSYSVYSYNGAAAYDVHDIIVEYVLNRPYAAFDNQIVHDLIVVSDTRARGVTPPSIDYKDNIAGFAGLVDVAIVSSATISQSDFFDYYFVDKLTMVDNSQFTMKISDITDDSVRTPGTYNKGLGDGK